MREDKCTTSAINYNYDFIYTGSMWLQSKQAKHMMLSTVNKKSEWYYNDDSSNIVTVALSVC